MKTGTTKLTELSPDKNAFILSFLAIMWRRVWITSRIYSMHNNIPINNDVVLKCLKYNILAPTGIGNTIKPYLVKALKVGFLMPKDYENNIYAERAIKLYSEAYKLSCENDREKEMNFIHSYASNVFKVDLNGNNSKELIDTMQEIDKENYVDELTIINIFDRLEEKHNCKLCSQIDIWDIELNLVHSEDPYQNVIMFGLLSALESSP